MEVNEDNKQDDFFSLLEDDQKIEDPFAADEILFRDKQGNLKVLKKGEVLDYDQKKATKSVVGTPTPSIIEKQAVEPKVAVKVKPPSSPPIGKPLKLDQEIQNIVNKSGITFSDQATEKRFSNIITLRLKEVRDQIQTRETLSSSPLVGGMGYDSETVDRILALISQEMEELDGKLREETSNDSPFYDLKAEAREILKEPIEKPPTLVFKPKVSSQKPVTQKLEPEISQKEQELQDQPAPVISIPRPVVSTDTTKPKIEDVKFQPRLTGPIEEIRSMTLNDFRRLGSTPKQSIEKILEKISLLEEESFTKKTDAIKAWKENDVHRLYLKLGDQSMEERKPISEIIKERQQANQPTLTDEELEIIIELNQKLRF